MGIGYRRGRIGGRTGQGAPATAPRARGAALLALLYLILQLVLALGAPAAAAPPILDRFGNPICADGSGRDHDKGGDPSHTQGMRCCAALCSAAAPAGPPPAAGPGLPPPRAGLLLAAPFVAFEIARPPLGASPRLTRGPPAAAASA